MKSDTLPEVECESVECESSASDAGEGEVLSFPESAADCFESLCAFGRLSGAAEGSELVSLPSELGMEGEGTAEEGAGSLPAGSCLPRWSIV